MATQPKQPDNPLELAFTRLDGQIKAGQLKKALKTVEEVLKLAPGDLDALKCKAILLVESSKFDEALALIDSKKLGDAFAFEQAYCFYRLGKFKESLEALKGVPEERAEARLQLEAQLRYRMGQNGDAINNYMTLFQKLKVTSMELRTNVVAAYVAGGRAGEVPAVMDAMKVSPKDGFEIAFNLACSVLQTGDLAKAQEQLQLAERLGRETLFDEDLTEEQVEQELSPLTVQLAFVASLLGRHSDAIQGYQAVLGLEQDDEATTAIAQNNLLTQQLAIAPESERRRVLNEAIRKLDAFIDKASTTLKLKASLETRLTGAQQLALTCNRGLLFLLAGRLPAARDLASQLAKKYPDTESVVLLRAAILTRDGKLAEADALLAGARPSAGASLQIPLMRVQLALLAGRTAEALKLLEGLGDAELQRRPALVATRAAVLEAAGDAAGALAHVKQAHSWWAASRQVSKADKAAALNFLLPRIAQLQLQTGAVEDAFKSYKQLKAADPAAASSAPIVAQLAKAAVRQNPAAACSLESELAPLTGLGASAIDKLEDTGSGRRSKGEEGARKRPQDGTEAAKPRKRKRKVILPKGFDPENPGPPPDPERWLPKWQRSDFKRKRRGSKYKDQVKGSQGAGKVDESLDRTNTDVAEGSSTARTGPPRPGTQSRKKGGKGRR